MKNMSDYPNTNPPTLDTPNGTFRNESQPNASDGTDIKAEHMQDVYYAIYQILQLAGEIPNGELENGNLSKQFIRCLTNIGWLKYDSSIAYKKSSVVINTISNITKIYRSQKDNNTDPLPDINNNNNTSWINIITINEDNTIIFNTVSNDNTGVFMGAFMYGIRQDTPKGWLRCDGSEYPISTYNNFVTNYIETGKITSITLAQYEEELLNNNNNCGYFGYDDINNTLRVPKLDDRVFIAQALNSGNICKYNQDQIVNIEGTISNITTKTPGAIASGAFNVTSNVADQVTGTGTNWYKSSISFDASRVVNTGDRVQPRHIQYPLFVCVSNVPIPATETQYNNFIDGLNNKINVDGNNANLNNLNNNAIDNIIIKTYQDLANGIDRTWNTVYQTTNAVCLIGRARTLTSNVPKIQVSLDNSTWFTLWSGEGYLVNGSPSFNLTIPKGYYYRGTGGTDGTLKEYKLMGYNN